MTKASVIIGTYGDKEIWRSIAGTAMASACMQSFPAEVIWSHEDTLQNARNLGAHKATGEWLIFLDADDALDEHYVESILRGSGDVRQPSTLGVYSDGHTDAYPVLNKRKSSFLQGNWIVIGAGVRHDLFDRVGGFGDEDLYEDWSLFGRCKLAGGIIGIAPEAIYRVTVHDPGTSRNFPEQQKQEYWFKKIASEMDAEAKRLGVKI